VPEPHRVDVVLPCLDEAAALPSVLAGLPLGMRAIVVDNGSRDDSASVARGLGAVVLFEPRRGFGAACAAGVLAATAPILAFCDADASLDLADLPRVVDPVARGVADLVLGRRRPATVGSWPLHARAANGVLAAMLRRRTGAALHDLGPMRAMGREALLALDLGDRRSGYPLELVLRAAAAGWRLAEVEVGYSPRIGRSKVTGTVRGTARAVTDMRRVLAEVPR
jgi:glycosyltransferase involved in cell wall biosynthesis